MDKEIFEKAIELHKELQDLEAVKNEILDKDYAQLEYVSHYETMWSRVGTGNARFRKILKQHEQQIKKEVDDAIELVKQQIAEL